MYSINGNSVCKLLSLLFFVVVLLGNIKTADAQNCPMPQNITLPQKNSNSITLKWNMIPTAEKILISYRETSNPVPQTVEVGKGENTAIIAGLLPSTNYELCLTALCASEDTLIESEYKCISFETCPENPVPATISGIVNGEKFCRNSTPMQMFGSPAGGIFSGPGVSGSQFTPSIAGPGTHVITYVVNNAGCISSAVITVTVVPPQNSSIAGITDGQAFCKFNTATYNLVGNPQGGHFTLDENPMGDTFSPSILTVGSHLLTYTPMNSCATATSISFSVVGLDQSECEAFAECPPPTEFRAILNVIPRVGLLSWGRADSNANANYQIAYREKGNKFWITRMIKGKTGATIQNLQPDVVYEARVRTICGPMKTSAWSVTTELNPPMNCSPDVSSIIISTSNDNATISWTPTEGAKKYFIMVRPEGSQEREITYLTTKSSIVLRNLTRGVRYEYRIKTICNDGNKSVVGPLIIEMN